MSGQVCLSTTNLSGHFVVPSEHFARQPERDLRDGDQEHHAKQKQEDEGSPLATRDGGETRDDRIDRKGLDDIGAYMLAGVSAFCLCLCVDPRAHMRVTLLFPHVSTRVQAELNIWLSAPCRFCSAIA